MNYFAYTFSCSPVKPLAEILVAQLADIGFESFEDTDSGVVAYVPEDSHRPEDIESTVHSLSSIGSITFEGKLIPEENWNAVWESEYPVVTIEKRCIVRAPFHAVKPSEYELDILINPQMSFGTGHHETTYLVLSLLLEMDMKNVSLLDMGSGTGVLAIAAKKLGAKRVDAIDSEEWAYKNTIENVELNNVDIHVQKAEIIPQESPVYGVILANINKNVLLGLMSSFAAHLSGGGTLILSGFFQTDVEEMTIAAEKNNFKVTMQKTKNSWAALKLIKQSN